ncbi:uncharacterized protein LOC122265420 [Penaeus japonicus]|uniref:uncharacterized protein LOC122265420 n=1 Tax=Penaeus japonicus TaxID=27405 RepID=UPI001C70C4DE|nr:uncharacterized protein LOC122265420 [Penaeus japonicus]XP_042890685.1 uncharacterized protein LOC122265420 [Penaeus japonicus]
MAHLPPMPKLTRIRRPMSKQAFKAKADAKQSGQIKCPSDALSFALSMSAASMEDRMGLSKVSNMQATSLCERLQQPPVLPSVSDPQPPPPYERSQQPPVQSRVPKPQAPPPCNSSLQLPVQSRVPKPQAPPPYDRSLQPAVESRVPNPNQAPPPYDRSLQPAVESRVPNPNQAPPPYDRSLQPAVESRVPNPNQAPPPYDRSLQPAVQSRVPEPPTINDKSLQPPVLWRASDSLMPSPHEWSRQPKVSINRMPCERHQPLVLSSVSDSHVPSHPARPQWPSDMSRQVSDPRTQSLHVHSQEPSVPSKVSNRQVPVLSNVSNQGTFTCERSQQPPMLSTVSNHQVPVLSKGSNQVPFLCERSQQLPMLSTVSNPQAPSSCERFQQPPVLSKVADPFSPSHCQWSQCLSDPPALCPQEWAQQPSKKVSNPLGESSLNFQPPPAQPYQHMLGLSQNGSNLSVPSPLEWSTQSLMLPRLPPVSSAAITYPANISEWKSFESRTSQIDITRKYKQPNMHQSFMQNTVIQQQYFQYGYPAQQTVHQSHYHHRQINQPVQQALQKSNYQHQNQPEMCNRYGHEQRYYNLQAFPQPMSGYQRGPAVPYSMQEYNTSLHHLGKPQECEQRKHIPTEVYQQVSQQRYASYGYPRYGQYGYLQQNQDIHKYQKQMPQKMQNEQLTSSIKTECVQQEQQNNRNLKQFNYDHNVKPSLMNEKTDSNLEKYSLILTEQIHHARPLHDHLSSDLQEDRKAVLQIRSEKCQQSRSQQALSVEQQVNPSFQQRNGAHIWQNTDTATEIANALLTNQRKEDRLEDSFSQLPSHCMDSTQKTDIVGNHESVEFYSQRSKIEVSKHSISNADKISDKTRSHSPTPTQTVAMNYVSQPSPPPTPIDLRKAKENISIQADPKLVDSNQAKFNVKLCEVIDKCPQFSIQSSVKEMKPVNRSPVPINVNENCNDTNSTQYNAHLLQQTFKEHDSMHACDITSSTHPSKTLLASPYPTRNPTIFSPTPPPTPPDEPLSPEWKGPVSDLERKKAIAENDFVEKGDTVISHAIAKVVTEEHNAENSASLQQEISLNIVENKEVNTIVNKEQIKIPKLRINLARLNMPLSPIKIVFHSLFEDSSEEHNDNRSPVTQEEGVLTENSQKSSRKTAKNSKLHVNIPIPKEQPTSNQQKSPLPLDDPSPSVTEVSTEDCSVVSSIEVQKEIPHKVHDANSPCGINGLPDPRNISPDNQTIQQANSEEKKMTDEMTMAKGKNQVQDISIVSKENSLGFGKHETSTADAETLNASSKCSDTSATQRLEATTKEHNTPKSSKIYDCIGSVYFISRCFRTMCFVCKREITGKNVINHLFFPHLKCKTCKVTIRSCKDYSQLKNRLRKGKPGSCNSSSGYHNFDRWGISPVDFLAYTTRKLLVYREKRSYHNQPSEKEVINEMEKYIKNLSMLQFLFPWKNAIRSCNKYVKTVKATLLKTNQQTEKRKTAEDLNKENDKVKRAKTKCDAHVHKSVPKTEKRKKAEDLDKENNKVKRARAKCDAHVHKSVPKTHLETVNNTNHDQSCNQAADLHKSRDQNNTPVASKETIVSQEKIKDLATKEETMHSRSIITEIIQKPVLTQLNEDLQPQGQGSSVDGAHNEECDDFLLNSCSMDVLDKMTTYVSVSYGP